MRSDRAPSPPGGAGRRSLKSRIPAPLRRGLLLFVLLLIIEYLVIPELVGARKDLNLLGRLNIGWMIAGLVLEGVSLFCYALLTRALLLPGRRPGLSRLFRIDLAAAAVAHVIPAGTVGSAGVGYRLFTADGVPGTDAGVMMATKGMGSTVVLNVLLWLSLVISIPLAGFHPIYVSVAIVGAVALALVAALAFGLTRGEGRAPSRHLVASRARQDGHRAHGPSRRRHPHCPGRVGSTARQPPAATPPPHRGAHRLPVHRPQPPLGSADQTAASWSSPATSSATPGPSCDSRGRCGQARAIRYRKALSWR
jgi:Lysylphosphatidylglycerol synthase TM region